jgi:flagellar L-ring protein FlgH
MQLRVWVLCVMCATGSALGQTTATPRVETAEQPRAATQRRAPFGAEQRQPRSEQDANLTPAPTVDAPALLRDHGNSLLKASIAVRTLPNQAQLKDISFISVPIPEPKVIRKHDLVTIIVREESQFTSEGNAETKRESKIDAAIEDFIQFKLKNWEIQGGAIGPSPPRLAGNFNREFKGEGTVDRSDTFTARITAEVLDVKPNGTLVVQARKRIKTDEEEQAFILTGVCRAEDITADNSILSTQLYDLELSKRHKGTVRNATRKGWGGKLLDAISPF